MQQELIDKNVILKLSIQFSLILIDYCEALNESKKYIVSNQLLRSGTPIGANSLEAQNAESTADFIHKFKIAAKEADETQYWLILCSQSKAYPGCTHLAEKLSEIQRVLNAILSSAKKRKPFSYLLSFFIF